ITLLTLIALKLAKVKGEISNSDYRYHLQELELIPEKVESALKSEEHIKMIANKYKNARNFLYLGRGYNFPVALEGALKLKEISYIHAEGYPDRKSTRLNSSHVKISYAVFCLKKKKI